MKKILKKIIKVSLYIIGGLLAIVLGLVVILWIKSPGVADPITDLNGKTLSGSISTIEKITLGEQDQYLLIRGADTTKPVMLFLHGGPGSPEIAFIKKYNSAIENDFTMVYWEQRGAGKSYSKNTLPESMTLTQLVSDTRELSKYLAKRFKQNKIYLMGHSWGSLLGIVCAYQYPELFHSFIGVGQVAYLYESEKSSFEWVKEQAIKRDDQNAVNALSEISFPDPLAGGDVWWNYLNVERKYVGKFGGGFTRKIAGMWPILKMALGAKEYTISDKINLISGTMFSMEHLLTEMVNKNLFNDIDSMQIPVYIFQGKYDHVTSYSIAKDFFEQLKSPQKEFFTFENSAHSPILEEADKFNAILREKVLKK